jgi:hypothetical protein
MGDQFWLAGFVVFLGSEERKCALTNLHPYLRINLIGNPARNKPEGHRASA